MDYCTYRKELLLLLCAWCILASFLSGYHSTMGGLKHSEVKKHLWSVVPTYPRRTEIRHTIPERIDPGNNTRNPTTASVRKREWIILTTTNGAFLDFTDNWLESLRRCGIKDHVAIVAEDEQTRNHLLNVTDFEIDVLSGTGKSFGNFLKFGSKDYNTFVNKRPNYILRFLEQGTDVLFSDVDTVWLENPLPHFPSEFDIHLETDVFRDPPRPDVYCAGFVYYRATNATITFIKLWMKMMQLSPKMSDQEVLNELLEVTTGRSIRVNKLDHVQFPSGKYFFDETWRRKHQGVKPVIVHNNFIRGHDIKVERFKNESMWYL